LLIYIRIRKKTIPAAKPTGAFSPLNAGHVDKSLYIRGLQTRYAKNYYNLYRDENARKKHKKRKK
jgi:hypothetical protein